MDNNPYDTSLEWTNFHSQPTENVRQHEEGTHSYPLTPSYQQEKIRPKLPVKRLSKREALEMVSALKVYIVLTALLGFGTLGGLVATQIFTTNTNINQPQTAPDGHARFRHWSYSSGPSDSGGFFNQQGQGQTQGGGYGFGQGSNSSPFSGSHTS